MNKLNQIISETFEVSISEVNSTDDITAYPNWDSMTHMILITTIEEEFEIELTSDEIVEMETVADIEALIGKRDIKS
jgi:acyl carrier protein